MTLNRSFRWIAIVEGLGFLAIIGAVWMDEYLDLPYRIFGGNTHAPVMEEALFESLAILLLWAIVVLFTYRLFCRIEILEAIVPICSFCKKVRAPGADPERQESWQAVEMYIHQKTGSQFSHGLCPECFKTHYGKFMEDKD